MADIQISLAAARVNANMTQDNVAKILRVSKKSIVNWENGKVKPNAATLYTLAGIYKIPVDAILLPEEFTLSE